MGDRGGGGKGELCVGKGSGDGKCRWCLVGQRVVRVGGSGKVGWCVGYGNGGGGKSGWCLGGCGVIVVERVGGSGGGGNQMCFKTCSYPKQL